MLSVEKSVLCPRNSFLTGKFPRSRQPLWIFFERSEPLHAFPWHYLAAIGLRKLFEAVLCFLGSKSVTVFLVFLRIGVAWEF